MGKQPRFAILIAGLTFMIALAGPAGAAAFSLTSTTFAAGTAMPKSTEFRGMGCSGGNISPQLSWTGAPRRTKSFVLTVHDPDAPMPGGWWHWVRYGIPPIASGLAPGAKGPGFDATTSFKAVGYGGPCPPPGDRPHHYRFVLWALDVPRIGATPATTGPELVALMRGHILAQTVLVGRFGRPK